MYIYIYIYLYIYIYIYMCIYGVPHNRYQTNIVTRPRCTATRCIDCYTQNNNIGTV